jgi:hypothetical protein
MMITRRAFLKLSGAAVVFFPFAKYAEASAIKIPVLMYHEISPRVEGNETLLPRLFAAQMEWLYGMGYRAVSFGELDALDPDKAGRTVIVTFDGGYASFMDYGFRLFSEYGFKATINVIGEDVGGFVSGNDPRLSWDECRFLAGSGIAEIGCRTRGLTTTGYDNLSRPRAAVTYNKKLEKDLSLFQNVYTRELGTPARVLAWTDGVHDDKSIAIARQAGFRYLLGSENAFFEIEGNQRDIPRLIMCNEMNLRQFRGLMERKP